MSNFDYLKNINEELYEIGLKLEEDVIKAPRAVTADATLFLETLVKDIYKISKKKLDFKRKSFYKKIDILHRSGEISYIFKNKLQEAYALRNKIHSNSNIHDEEKIAFELHKRLYYISKKYFKDYYDDSYHITIPKYKKPSTIEINFENCVICGIENKNAHSNICKRCNMKIENTKFLISIENIFGKNSFTRQDLINLGISENETISLLMEMTKEKTLDKYNESYTLNEQETKRYIEQTNQYLDIELLITRFYKDEIDVSDIKNTLEYLKGSLGQKPFLEFYKLVCNKLEKKFEKTLCEYKNIKKSMKLSSMDEFNIKEWFKKQRNYYREGISNDAFIVYNQLLLKDFYKLKMKGLKDRDILNYLKIDFEIHDFWKNEYLGTDYSKETTKIKKELIIKEIKKNKTLKEALNVAGVTENEFNNIYQTSQQLNGKFSKRFNQEYIHKRQKSLIKLLKNNNLKSAIYLSKITEEDFFTWYYESEIDLSNFYIKTSEILMKKYISLRQKGLNKQKILSKLNITKDMVSSWLTHTNLKIFKDFKNKNNEITSLILKKGIIINNLKDGKTKKEAIYASGLTYKEFNDIYNSSIKEKTSFYKRFNEEYIKNRKTLFSNLIKENDFYTAIQKCEITQKEFNEWYLKDQDKYLSSGKTSEFYITTTSELMNKYIKARRNGKNKPDAAKNVGLSNMTIKKWIKHTELDIFQDFNSKIKELTVELIIEGFNEGKSKSEVCEIYDISKTTIDKFINMGRKGFKRYNEVFNLYENTIIPNQLNTFLKDFKTKSLNKCLKHTKLTKKELKYYYNLGKSGNNNFSDFYGKLFNLKIKIYVDNILMKKSAKVALKNSNLTKEELKECKDKIDNLILEKRIEIISEELIKYKTNGFKIAKKIGITTEEIYDWFFQGKNGNQKYKEFYIMFELAVVLPRVVSYNKGLEIGIPKNWLLKQIKKDIGIKDFTIWQQNDIFQKDYEKHINIDDEEMNSEKISNFLNSLSNVGSVKIDENSPTYKFLKESFYGDGKNDGENYPKISMKVIKRDIVG